VLSGWIPEDMLAQLKGLIEHQAPKTTIMIEEEKNLPIARSGSLRICETCPW